MQSKITNCQYLLGKLAEVATDDFSLPWGTYPCIEWPYCTSDEGYGLVRYRGHSHNIQRVSYAETRGSIPKGGRVMLLCSNRLCFRPIHLSARDGGMHHLRNLLDGLADDPALPWNAYPCLEWDRGRKDNGYGAVAHQGAMSAHVLALTTYKGAIPAGQVVCHHCDNRPCIRPSHLFCGSLGDNNLDMRIKNRYVYNLPVTAKMFTEAQVLEVRRLYDGGMRQCRIAKHFDASRESIWNIVHRKNWKHV